jgi:hypothetical protein
MIRLALPLLEIYTTEAFEVCSFSGMGPKPDASGSLVSCGISCYRRVQAVVKPQTTVAALYERRVLFFDRCRRVLL